MARERSIGSGENLQIHARSVAIVLAAILAALAVVGFGLAVFFPERIGVSHVLAQRFPAPAVIADEHLRRLQLEARQRRALNGGDGRMPIDQAMQAIVARGDHAFDPVAP